MITILVCTAAGMLCAAMGWFAGRSSVLASKTTKHIIADSYQTGYEDGYYSALEQSSLKSDLYKDAVRNSTSTNSQPDNTST